MEQREEKWRGSKATGADGGDLLQAQAQMWIDLGTGLAGMLRRMLRRADPAPADQDGPEDKSSSGSDQDAA